MKPSNREVKRLLNSQQKADVRASAVQHFRGGVTSFKECGAVLSETEGGQVKADFIIGDETIPTLRFPKANLADDKWAKSTLRNLDAALTKAQMKAEIAAAVRDEPL